MSAIFYKSDMRRQIVDLASRPYGSELVKSAKFLIFTFISLDPFRFTSQSGILNVKIINLTVLKDSFVRPLLDLQFVPFCEAEIDFCTDSPDCFFSFSPRHYWPKKSAWAKTNGMKLYHFHKLMVTR